MSHPEQLDVIRRVRLEFPESFSGKRVLEVGSWNVNGTVRSNFVDCDYVGVDVAEGPGVDLVCPGQSLDVPSNSFDTVISCECFEHNPFWLETFINMLRALKPGGLCLVTCASTGRIEHGTRRMTKAASLSAEVGWFADYYRNLAASDFYSAMNLENHLSHHFFQENVFSRDLYFCGIKRFADGQDSPQYDERMARLKASVNEIQRLGVRPKGPLSKSRLKWLRDKALISLLGEQRHRDLVYRQILKSGELNIADRAA